MSIVNLSVLKARLSTVTITRVGTSEKYASGWDKAFGSKKSAAKKSVPVATAKAGTSASKKKSKVATKKKAAAAKKKSR